MRVPACSLPHVAFTVSELAAVTSVQGWSNRKVKVIGRLRNYDPTNKLAVLESVAEQEGVFQIKVSWLFLKWFSKISKFFCSYPVQRDVLYH